MKRLSRLVVCGVVGWCALATLNVRQAHAIKEFREGFGDMYVKKEPKTDEEKALAKSYETAKCNVCHAGTTKKERNAYGQELAKLLDRKTDKTNTQKIKDSLEKVGKMHSKPGDDKSPTYDDLIKQGKLPVDPSVPAPGTPKADAPK